MQILASYAFHILNLAFIVFSMRTSNSGVNRTIGYFILHRHGHRAPARNVILGGTPQTTCHIEEMTWLSLLPDKDSLSMMSKNFPVEFHPLNNRSNDNVSYPFGCLTARGLRHMKVMGEALGDRFPLLKNPASLEVTSTNYLRTQQSTQALLTGLGSTASLKVKVRESSKCSMSFYDGNPAVAARLVREVQSQQSFIELEEGVKHVKEALLLDLPMLRREKDGSFDWMSAFDYFACRRAHGIEFADSCKYFSHNVDCIILYLYSFSVYLYVCVYVNDFVFVKFNACPSVHLQYWEIQIYLRSFNVMSQIAIRFT